MLINKVLNDNKLSFQCQNYDPNTYIYKIEDRINIVTIRSKSSAFSIDRDLFYYLSNQKLIYAFIFENEISGKIFYLEFYNKNNWLNSSFERSNKEKLFFGKIVLNNQSDIKQIINRIKNIVFDKK